MLALIPLALLGCAELAVQVDVLDSGSVRTIVSDARQARLLATIVEQEPAYFADQIHAVRRSHDEVFEQLADLYRCWGAAAGDPELTDVLMLSASNWAAAADPDGWLAPLYANWESVVIYGNQQIIALWEDHAVPPGEPIPQDVRQALARRAAEERAAKEPILANLQEARKDLLANAAAAEGEQQACTTEAYLQEMDNGLMLAQKLAKSIIGEGSLVSSEFAYPVARAPETDWASKFNHALGKGTFGNVDVVIRMNETGDFSVKGMQFDPSTVAAVASKVGTQSLLLAAQIAGVPVASSALSDESKAGLGSTGDPLLEIQQSEISASAKQNAKALALRNLARAIIAEESAISSGTSAERDAADAAIRAVFAANRSIIKMAD